MIDKFIQDIAIKAGKITLKYFNNTEVAYTKKNALDIVTHADLAANKIIIDSIKKHFPNDGIITEETDDYNSSSDSVWIVDPLDGTLNFSKGIPIFCVLIAHVHKNKIDLGAIYDPIHDELYFAANKKGAFLNAKQIKCTQEKEINSTVGMINSRFDKLNMNIIKKIHSSINKESVTLMSINCLGLSSAEVASGKRDWFISTGAGGDWDYAAGKIILEEAGCIVTNIKGKPWQLGDKTIVTANPFLHKKLIDTIL